MKTIEQIIADQKKPRGKFIETNSDLSPHAIMAMKIKESYKDVADQAMSIFSKTWMASRRI